MIALPWRYAAGAVLLAVLAWWGYSWAYGRGEAAVRAQWAAAVQKQAQAAARTEGQWQGRVDAADRSLADAQTDIATRDAVLVDYARRLREYAARPRPVSGGADASRCVTELAAERDRADTLAGLLARGGDLNRQLALERDDAVARLWSAAEAWPVPAR